MPEAAVPSHAPAPYPPSAGTVIVGAGQAGLALSRCLTELGRPHVLLERGRVAERWRSERWDSFRLLSPNWHTRLPGHRYDGDDPDGFMGRRDVVAMFERYARSFAAPVLEHTTVHQVARAPDGGWTVATDRGVFAATDVVVATGPHAAPRIPACADDLPASTVQLHSSAYRNPTDLPPGGVLVVGAGPTGQQLASELARAGRPVWLAVGRHRRLPRRYRGHDAFWWLERTGVSEETVDPTRPRPHPPHPVLAADRDLGLDVLTADGVQPVGRLASITTDRLRFDDSLPQEYLDAERSLRRFRAVVDAHVAVTGLDVPAEDPLPPLRVPRWADRAPRHLDVRDVAVVVWATGFRRDLAWVPREVLDDRGEPVHTRGVTAEDGLYFLGLSWLHRRASASIDGVGVDARHLASVIGARSRPDLGGWGVRAGYPPPMAARPSRRTLSTSPAGPAGRERHPTTNPYRGVPT